MAATTSEATQPVPERLNPNRPRPRVIIIGAGLAGIMAAQRLAKLPIDVTVIDRTNHHTFQPLLYQVALAVLSPGDIAQPIRSILRNATNTEVMMDEVLPVSYTHLDVYKRQVRGAGGEDEVVIEHLGAALEANPARDGIDAQHLIHHHLGVGGVAQDAANGPVSYTHLDVYKRQFVDS